MSRHVDFFRRRCHNIHIFFQANYQHSFISAFNINYQHSFILATLSDRSFSIISAFFMNINRFFVYELLHINLWLTFFLYHRTFRFNITFKRVVVFVDIKSSVSVFLIIFRYFIDIISVICFRSSYNFFVAIILFSIVYFFFFSIFLSLFKHRIDDHLILNLSSFWRQLILQWESIESLLHFCYALFAVIFHHISVYYYITLSSIRRFLFLNLISLKTFNMSDFRSHWSTKSDFSHRSTYSLVNNDFIHVEGIIVQSKINSSQMTKFFFAANYGMYNVHPANGVMDFTFLSKMSKIEIVLQNSHIFLFMISSSVKKSERDKMFFADFNAKGKLLASRSFRERVVFFENKDQVFFNSATRLSITVSLWRDQDAFMYGDKFAQDIIIAILKLSAFVIINLINYQFLVQSKFRSIQSFKSTQSRFKSKVIKFVGVKKVYISEDNDDDDDSNGDEPTSHDSEGKHSITFIKTFFVVSESVNTNTFVVSFTFDASVFDSEVFQQHFITFIKTFFVVSESINTNIFVVSFTFDASVFDSEVFQQHFITFIKTLFVVSESVNTNIFVVSAFVLDKINDEIISIGDISGHSAISFDQFVLFSFFENVSGSIFFFRNVIILSDNTSHEKSDIVSEDIV